MCSDCRIDMYMFMFDFLGIFFGLFLGQKFLTHSNIQAGLWGLVAAVTAGLCLLVHGMNYNGQLKSWHNVTFSRTVLKTVSFCGALVSVGSLVHYGHTLSAEPLAKTPVPFIASAVWPLAMASNALLWWLLLWINVLLWMDSRIVQKPVVYPSTRITRIVNYCAGIPLGVNLRRSRSFRIVPES